MGVVLDIILVILLADFVSGVFHWAEDAYGRPEWPLTGRLITQPNIRHHFQPTYFTRHSWLKSAQVLLVFGAAILASAWALGLLTWQVLLFVAIGVNANEIHKWNHLPRSRRHSLVVFLQRIRLLQHSGHHARHHRGGKDTHYCVITNLVNPVLEAIDFWRRVERLLAVCFGIRKRHDPSLGTRTSAAFA